MKYILQMQCLKFKSFAYYKSEYKSQSILSEGGFSVAHLIIQYTDFTLGEQQIP